MRDISLKAVLVGGVVDIVGSMLMGIPIMVWAMSSLDTARLTDAAQAAAVMDAVRTEPKFYVTGLALGCLWSVIGGYVAGRIARRRPMLHGALSAILCVLFSVVMMLRGDDVTSPALHVVFFALSPLLGALGGYFAGRDFKPDGIAPQAA